MQNGVLAHSRIYGSAQPLPPPLTLNLTSCQLSPILHSVRHPQIETAKPISKSLKGAKSAKAAEKGADKSSSAVAKDGGSIERAEGDATDVCDEAADGAGEETTKMGTRVMRAPSWTGVSRQSSFGGVPEMSLKSFDESMQQLFTGESRGGGGWGGDAKASTHAFTHCTNFGIFFLYPCNPPRPSS